MIHPNQRDADLHIGPLPTLELGCLWLFVHLWLRRSAAKQGTRNGTTDTTRKVEYGRRQFPDSGHDLPSTRSCAACYAGQGVDPKMLRKLLRRVNARAGPG